MGMTGSCFSGILFQEALYWFAVQNWKWFDFIEWLSQIIWEYFSTNIWKWRFKWLLSANILFLWDSISVKPVLTSLIHANTTSSLDDYNSLLLGLSDKLVEKLQSIQTFAARMVTGYQTMCVRYWRFFIGFQ